MDFLPDSMNNVLYTLPAGVIVPLFFAGLIALCSARNGRAIRALALVGTLVPCVWYALLAGAFNWDHGTGDHFATSVPWFATAGINFSFGADTISMLLVGLTVLLGPICVLASTTAITERLRTYYAWLLILQAAMTGVFLARDVILFYTFFEFTLVPLYILINLYGSTNRKAAATKFFLYTFTGSLLTLVGLLYVAKVHHDSHHVWAFAFGALAETARGMSFTEQAWVFWALLAGFAIKVPLFPVHTWLPLAHTEAPTAGSVILASVLLKLGTYGIYRFALGFVPAACTIYAPTMAVLSVVGIVYAGLICWVQTDVKKLIAYSSVSHLGYCVLGLFALNSFGLTGSVLYMINHGLSTGALFLLIGMVYERYHTRSLKEIGGLARVMPVWASFMVFFTMASVGLPGLNGFVSEFFCTLGAFQAAGVRFEPGSGVALLPGATWGELGPWYGLAAGTGIIVTAMYLLYMLGKFVWGPLHEPGSSGHGHGHHNPALPRDLCGREIGILLPLAALCLVLGLFPTPILRWLEAPTAEVAKIIQVYGRDRLAADDPRVRHAPGPNAGAIQPASHDEPRTPPAAEGQH
ncbi:MAG TPA: NADH-quinone oxidoreductase subunit M [Phycisphaerales bacterium]|nr:NADH-quinone oxidoreductase subunit M [Phycisphaerales bacterium]